MNITMNTKLLALLVAASALPSSIAHAEDCNTPSYNRDKDSCNASTDGSWDTSWTGNGWQPWRVSGVLDLKAGQPQELAASAIVEHNTCNGISAESEVKVTAAREDATSYSLEYGLTKEVKAEIAVKVIGSLGIGATESFKTGVTTSTTISKSIEHTVKVGTGPYKITKSKVIILGMVGGQVKIGVFRERRQWGRCCFDSWYPFDKSCTPWTAYVCETESKDEWTTPAKQSLSQAWHKVVPAEAEKACPPGTGSGSSMPPGGTTPPPGGTTPPPGDDTPPPGDDTTGTDSGSGSTTTPPM